MTPSRACIESEKVCMRAMKATRWVLTVLAVLLAFSTSPALAKTPASLATV
jgi:hypothetical protein